MSRAQSRRGRPAGRQWTDDPADLIALAAQAVVFLRLVLIAVLFDPAASDTFSLPKSAAAHALAYLLAALLLAYVIVRGPRAVPFSPAHIATVGLLVAFAAATPLAVDQTIALYGSPRRYLGLANALDLIVLYFGIVVFFRDAIALRRLFVVGVAASLPVDLYAIAQLGGVDPLTFVQGSTRTAISTLGQPDILAGYLSIVASTAAGVVVLEWARLTRIGRGLMATISLLGVAILLANAIRAGLLGLVGGGLAVLGIAVARRAVDRRIVAAGVLAAVAVVLAVIASPMRARLSLDAIQQSLEARLDIWQTALQAIRDRPLLGLGPDNFVAAYPSLHSARSVVLQNNLLQNSTHDVFLYVGTSAGVIGLLAFVVLLAILIGAGFQSAARRDVGGLALVPLLAYLGQGVFNVNELALDSLFWISAGVIATRSAVEWPLRWGRPPMGATAAASMAVLLVVAAAIAGSAQIHRLEASEAVAASQSLVSAGRGLDAVQASRKAVIADDRRSENWAAFGTALTSAGNATAAETAFRDALARQPWQPLYWRDIALLRLQEGDLVGTREAFARTLAADPFDADSHQLLGTLAYNEEKYAEAAEQGGQAVALVPQRGTAYEVPVKALIRLGRVDDAERLVRQGLARPDIVEPRMLQVLNAEVLAARGRLQEARQAVDAVLSSYPDYSPALSLLSRLGGR